jgi:SAM-dependent methyltransferase
VAAGPTADVDFPDPSPGVTVSAGATSVRPGGADVAVAFDVLDRCADPRAVVASVHRALRPGGLLFVVAPSISGFDLQVMWERSRTITPPDRINLFSLRGFRELFASGWMIREISTPGMFDAETVRRAILSDPRGDWPRALRAILVDSGPEVLADFQEFLQRHRLSSFGRLMLQKVE